MLQIAHYALRIHANTRLQADHHFTDSGALQARSRTPWDHIFPCVQQLFNNMVCNSFACSSQSVDSNVCLSYAGYLLQPDRYFRIRHNARPGQQKPVAMLPTDHPWQVSFLPNSEGRQI